MWRTLRVAPTELRLENTLPAGQSFRWEQSASGTGWVGIASRRLFALEQDDGRNTLSWRVLARTKDALYEHDEHTLVSTLCLCSNDPSLETLQAHFAQCDYRYKLVSPYLQGARVMRQEPLETLLAFICSSNNNINRISQLVESLCAEHGDPLDVVDSPDALAAESDSLNARLHAFPRFDALAHSVNEEHLRNLNFGYRAPYIVSTVAALAAHCDYQPGTDPASSPHAVETAVDVYLHRLRTDFAYEEAKSELSQLPGVGPKVASCICLFALDKTQAVPVDTHVWRIAQQHYGFKPSGKSLTPKTMAQVEDSMRNVFGEYCGWALNVLFAAELSRYRTLVPQSLRTSRSNASSATDGSESYQPYNESTEDADEQKEDAVQASQDAADELAQNNAPIGILAPKRKGKRIR